MACAVPPLIDDDEGRDGDETIPRAAAPVDESVQFHVLAFEGPDPYSRAGGISSRVTGLVEALAERGFETHLWFVGDPQLPGHEVSGRLHLHRWCQWISRYHPGGVYDGEEGKQADFGASLPPFLLHEALSPHLRGGGSAVVLAEEWHTSGAVLHLDWLLRREGARARTAILWNANNVFGFDRIDWQALGNAATITTVSRYMKHLMRGRGVDPVAIPNGLAADAFQPVSRAAIAELGRRIGDRLPLAKIARWDPDKGWLASVGIVHELKRDGLRPLLVARGGVEAHAADVLKAAAAAGLRVIERQQERGVDGLLAALEDTGAADIVSLTAPVDSDSRRVLLQGAAAVLANSSHEPFGLVGLETMAAGGLACTGYSGEDYAVPGENAVVLQTDDPSEFVGMMHRLRRNPREERAIRRAGRLTARRYAWSAIVERLLLPRLTLVGG
jgi:glycosyltransferase involved in cell wall biosynthesis